MFKLNANAGLFNVGSDFLGQILANRGAQFAIGGGLLGSTIGLIRAPEGERIKGMIAGGLEGAALGMGGYGLYKIGSRILPKYIARS